MKIILGLCAATLLLAGLLVRNAMKSEAQYGEFVGAPRVDVTELLDRPEQYVTKTVKVEGEVREQCQTMGCHFFFVAGNRSLRIELEKLTATAPMRERHLARVEGRMAPFGDGYQLVATAVEIQ